MTDEQNPIEHAVDLFVFAPIGVAMFAKDTVPTFMKMFVSRGQTEIQQRKKSLHDHANQYRAVGKFAVKYGGPVVKQQAETKLNEAAKRAEETFSNLKVTRGGGDVTPPAPTPHVKVVKPDTPAKADAPKAPPKPKKVEAAKVESAATRSGTVANGAAILGTANGHAGNGKKKTTKVSSAAADATALAASALAIPEYDMLSASQVVERLDGLTPAELDAVRAYELAHRGRSTILGKITQLTA